MKSICTLIAIALGFSIASPCFAQYNVGDSVQCRPMGSQWYSGKITGKVDGGYKVMVDGHEYTIPDDGHSGSSRLKAGGGAGGGNGDGAANAGGTGNGGFGPPINPGNGGFGPPINPGNGGFGPPINPGNGGFGPPINPGNDNQNGKATSTVQTEGTVQGDRPCIDCTSGGPAGRNGDQPPMEALKRLLQCIWEKAARPGDDGAVTVDVRSLTPTGKRINGAGQRDTGRRFTDPLTSNPNTIIYMFDGSYIKKTFYRYRTQTDDTTHQVFEAFVGSDGRWHLQHASGPYTHTESSVNK